MSHYFYENAFDFIDSTGTLGYSIEQDKTLTSDSLGVVAGADDYIIEVHYLGNAATTLKLNVSNIDSSALTDVNYVQKEFAYRSGEDGNVNIDTYDTTLEAINAGQTSYSLQQGGLDPAFGMVQLHIPSTLTSEQQTTLGRDSDYLYLESALYFDVIQQDTDLVSSLQDLIDNTITITEFATAINTALTDPAVIPATDVLDATNDITSHAASNGYNLVVDQNPDMIHFDNISYYSYDNFGSAPRTLNVSEGSTQPLSGGTSETSLIGEFRISESSDSEWSINADFIISQNSDTTWQTGLSPVIENSYNINDAFNNSGVSRTFVEAATTISRNADGVLSFSETVPIINTIAHDQTTIINFASSVDVGSSYGSLQGNYSIQYYAEAAGHTSISLHRVEDTDSDGFYNINTTGSHYFDSSSNSSAINTLVDGINSGAYPLDTSYQMVSDGLVSNWNVVTLHSGHSVYYDDSGSISYDEVPSGTYLVNDIGAGNYTLTSIGADTDYDGIPELDASTVYTLYQGDSYDGSYYVDEARYFEQQINHNSSSITLESYLKSQVDNYAYDGIYETSENVITKMSQLGVTWDTIDYQGSPSDLRYNEPDGSGTTTSLQYGYYKVSVDPASSSVFLQPVYVNSDGLYEFYDTPNPLELSTASATIFEEKVNKSELSVTKPEYLQEYWTGGHEGDEAVNGNEVIQYAEDYVNHANVDGDVYVEGQAFDNTKINFINTNVATSGTVLNAGLGDDIIAGGVGTYTVDGGEGFDMYLASPATLEKVYDIAGEVVNENGVYISLSSSKVTYLNDNTVDDISNIEYFLGTTGDDIFIGAERYESLYDIQAFNGSGGSDQFFGAETAFAGTDQEINIKTAVDYSSMQGGQGAVFILDGSNVMSGADSDGNLSYSEVQRAAGEHWNEWLPYNEGTLGDNQTISTVSSLMPDKDGASVILDTFGDIDIAFNVDHYIGSDQADIFFGSNENDTFDAASGSGNYMSGGDGQDELLVNDLEEVDNNSENLNLSSIVIGRDYEHTNFQNVDVSSTGSDVGKLVDDADNDHSDGSLYRIDFADVNNLHAFIGDNVSTNLTGYDITAEYALFIRTTADPSSMTNVQFDVFNQKIDIAGTDISVLDALDGQLILAQQQIIAGQYIVEGLDESGNQYSTIIENVEKVTLTTDDVSYMGTGNLSGSQEDTYELILGGQGDLGDMLYVTTGEGLLSTTGVTDGYAAGTNFISGEVYYSGSHNDFDRTSNTNTWANSVAAAYTTTDGKGLANIWNDELAQFFVWYDADKTDGIDGYEIAVKYQNGNVNAWGIDNRQFDTFQNVEVTETLADAIKLQFGDSLNVETGSYRVLYEAAFSDIETIVGSNADVNAWNFDFAPSSSRSTFYIQVGGDTTGENGNSGVTDTNVTNVKVERVVDEVNGGFKWSVNPQAEILVNLPSVAGATTAADIMISGDAAQTIEAGRGSDVMMGRGGSDNYKINQGDTIETDGDGNVVAGDYGVAGDVINEIGGSSEDKADSITLSSAQSIDQLTFSRTEIKNEMWSSTLKIDVDYDGDDVVDDTLYVFDHFNQNLGFRAVEQLFLDDGWDSNEIWNLVVGDVNEAGVDEYNGSSGQDILMAGAVTSSLYGGDGQDIMVGDDNGLKTTFELGNREGVDKWDQIVDIIQGFGSNDELDLSNLGIEVNSELTFDGNVLYEADGGNKIAEFSNFNDGLTLEQLLTEDGAITYSSAV